MYPLAFVLGPGGPVLALVCTQTIYQTLINAVFFGQELTNFMIYAVVIGVASAVVISAGDDIIACFKRPVKEDTKTEALLNPDYKKGQENNEVV
jgi:hypothetical protein